MPHLRDYLTLCRVSNLPTVWTNVLAAVLLAGASAASPSCLLLAVSISCLYCAGMCLNDLWDREADRVGKPFRPLPSGRISTGEAGVVTLLLFATGLGTLALLPYREGLWVGMLLAATIVGYNRLHAGHAWSIGLMAACRLLVFVVSAAAVSGTVGLRPALGGGAQFAYVFVLSAIARWEKGQALAFPLIALLVAGISILDGLMLAVLVSPVWFGAGLFGFLLTFLAQRWVRGD